MVDGEQKESSTFVPLPSSVRFSRQLTARVCSAAGLPQEICETAVLLTSELVTNALIHGRSEVRVVVRAAQGYVRVEVGDDNSRHPVLQAEDPAALDGRGIGLLAACADDWGVRDLPFGKVVWFQLAAERTLLV